MKGADEEPERIVAPQALEKLEEAISAVLLDGAGPVISALRLHAAALSVWRSPAKAAASAVALTYTAHLLSQISAVPEPSAVAEITSEVIEGIASFLQEEGYEDAQVEAVRLAIFGLLLWAARLELDELIDQVIGVADPASATFLAVIAEDDEKQVDRALTRLHEMLEVDADAGVVGVGSIARIVLVALALRAESEHLSVTQALVAYDPRCVFG